MNEFIMGWFNHVARARVDCKGKDVLEVGSLDVNGNLRQTFLDAGAKSYTGVDMRAGANVDHVMNAHALGFPDQSFDIVVSSEMLEHDSHFWLSMQEMGRVLKPGGHLILTARGNGFQMHLHPDDYYRFMPSSFGVLFALAGCLTTLVMDDPHEPGLMAFGQKYATP